MSKVSGSHSGSLISWSRASLKLVFSQATLKNEDWVIRKIRWRAYSRWGCIFSGAPTVIFMSENLGEYRGLSRLAKFKRISNAGRLFPGCGSYAVVHQGASLEPVSDILSNWKFLLSIQITGIRDPTELVRPSRDKSREMLWCCFWRGWGCERCGCGWYLT